MQHEELQDSLDYQQGSQAALAAVTNLALGFLIQKCSRAEADAILDMLKTMSTSSDCKAFGPKGALAFTQVIEGAIAIASKSIALKD